MTPNMRPLRLQRPGYLGEVSAPGFVLVGPFSEPSAGKLEGGREPPAPFSTIHKPTLIVETGKVEMASFALVVPMAKICTKVFSSCALVIHV